jgi:CBS domain-containing protein
MIIKHATSIDMEDEFLRISPDLSMQALAEKFLAQKTPRGSKELEDRIFTPILTAYVMEGDKPIGVIDKDALIEALIVQKQDPQETRARDIMKSPMVFNENTPIQDVLNAIIDKGLLTVAIVEDEKLIGVISVFDAIFLQQELDCTEERSGDKTPDDE